MDGPSGGALDALLQQGSAGAVAVLAIMALAYVMRRFVTHLEASEKRSRDLAQEQAKVLGGISSVLVEQGHQAELHHQEVLGRMRGLQSEVEMGVDASRAAAEAASRAADAARRSSEAAERVVQNLVSKPGPAVQQ